MKTKPLNEPKGAIDPGITNTKPILISFALVKRQNNWHAVAIKSQGREIIDERIIESDDYRSVALDAFDRASHEYLNHDVDPFDDQT